MECHGSLGDGSIVMYGDEVRGQAVLAEDFPADRDVPVADWVDLVMVFGTSLQVWACV